jgi:hypothetical protein
MTDNFEAALREELRTRSQVSRRDVDALRAFALALPARRSLARRRAFEWALSAAALALVAAVAAPLLSRNGGPGGLGATASPSALPTIGPAPSEPAETPVEALPAGPTPAPGATERPIVSSLRLAVGSGSIVTVDMSDPQRLLLRAIPEKAEAAATVPWLHAVVTDAGDNGLRIRWIGSRRDETLQLDVTGNAAGKLLLHFTQSGPPENSDDIGEDRVLVVYPAERFSPANVEVTFTTP